MIEEIRKLINEDIKPDAKNFLDCQIQTQIGDSNTNNKRKNYNKLKIFEDKTRKGPAAVVTKTQIKVKYNFKNSQSEEATIQVLSLVGALKNRTKNIKINSNAENLPTLPEKGGFDRSFWGGTYYDVRNLYLRATSNQPLKADDKDNYLVEKFIDKQKWFTSSFNNIANGNTVFDDFLTDRLISAIFCTISKRQKLHEKAINKLLRLFDNIDIVKKLILGS